MSRTIALRADAGRQIGTGHVMRCLALAQGWRGDGGEAVFLSAEMPEALAQRLRQESIDLLEVEAEPGSREDGARTAELGRESGADWLVIDGYRFGDEFFAAAHRPGAGMLLIDDLGFPGATAADFVLNQNIYARAELYPGIDAGTGLLLGTRYALLRDEFVAARRGAAAREEASRVLVSLGGSDPTGATRTVIAALDALARDDVEALVLIGPAADDEGIEEAASRSRTRVRVQRGVQDMATVLLETDVAVCAAGSVAWELCYMGVPAILIATALNQEPIAAGAAANGVALDGGKVDALEPQALAERLGALIDDAELRRSMCALGRTLVDGHGRVRVIETLRAVSDRRAPS